MKRILCVFIAMVVFCGCSASNKPVPIVDVNIEQGTFSITPQEFVEQWNAILLDFQKDSDDEKADYIIPLPDFEKSDKIMSLADGLDVIYLADETSGKMTKFTMCQYSFTITNEGALTAGFIISAMPKFFNPESDIDLVEEFQLDQPPQTSSMNCKNAVDGNVVYQYVAVDGLGNISAEPIHLTKNQ